MHHPGPPRFVAVGDDVELAPRDPDPAATYRWRVAGAPEGSTATLGEDPVEHLAPDVPGRYRVELTAPDGTHGLTVRAFPADLTGGGPAGGGYASGDAAADERAPLADEADDAYGGEEAAATGEGGRPRLALSAATTDEAVVVRATPRAHPDGPETAADLDVEFLLDDRDPVDRSAVEVDGRELVVPRDVVPERLRVHAVAVGREGYSVPDAVAVEREGADGDVRTSRPYDPPEWGEDAVIYEIYLRSFPGQGTGEADGAVFDAVVERLDYVAGLGVDALWLTPVLENDHAPHGYNVTDFLAIAEDLGTREDYERLIEAAHDRGLKVLFDLVCNHSARAHPHFQAAVSDPDSPYRDWYEWRGPAEPETYFDWEHIANFDFDHLPVRRHLLDAVEQWAPLVDGFRCDMAWAVPDGFWRELHDRLKGDDDGFLLLDETIPYIPDFQAGLFDVHFDSTTYAALRRVGHGDAPADDVLDAVEERARVGFPDHAGFMLYAENHDEARYLADCGRPAARAALGALFTLPGSPMVYAGQEFGQLGKRDPLAWDHADGALQAHVRRLAAARAEEGALAAGADLRRLPYEVVDGEPGRVVAFGRAAENGLDAAVVVLNFGAAPATVAVDAAAGDDDVVTGEGVRADEGLRVDDVVVVPADPAALGGRP